MYSDSKGPIEAFVFGTFTINGIRHSEDEAGNVTGAGKDICLTPEGITPWNERKGHLLKREMLRPALTYLPDLLIIGCGAQGRLQCPNELVRYLKKSGIECILAVPTAEACAEYNRACKQGTRVMLLAHGTC
ncbi:MAG: Mth938-like domain-containing protein [Chloroflexi bacterium]|nr:Mth938-like domain-containing protein [Chloroflexota bacterium]